MRCKFHFAALSLHFDLLHASIASLGNITIRQKQEEKCSD